MRIIDVDVLTDYVTKVYEYDLYHADGDEYTEGRASAEHKVLEKIRELPTIDAIPVEWLNWRIMNAKRNGIKEAADAFEFVLKCWKEQEAQK